MHIAGAGLLQASMMYERWFVGGFKKELTCKLFHPTRFNLMKLILIPLYPAFVHSRIKVMTTGGCE